MLSTKLKVFQDIDTKKEISEPPKAIPHSRKHERHEPNSRGLSSPHKMAGLKERSPNFISASVNEGSITYPTYSFDTTGSKDSTMYMVVNSSDKDSIMRIINPDAEASLEESDQALRARPAPLPQELKEFSHTAEIERMFEAKEHAYDTLRKLKESWADIFDEKKQPEPKPLFDYKELYSRKLPPMIEYPRLKAPSPEIKTAGWEELEQLNSLRHKQNVLAEKERRIRMSNLAWRYQRRQSKASLSETGQHLSIVSTGLVDSQHALIRPKLVVSQQPTVRGRRFRDKVGAKSLDQNEMLKLDAQRTGLQPWESRSPESVNQQTQTFRFTRKGSRGLGGEQSKELSESQGQLGQSMVVGLVTHKVRLDSAAVRAKRARSVVETSLTAQLPGSADESLDKSEPSDRPGNSLSLGRTGRRQRHSAEDSVGGIPSPTAESPAVVGGVSGQELDKILIMNSAARQIPSEELQLAAAGRRPSAVRKGRVLELSKRSLLRQTNECPEASPAKGLTGPKRAISSREQTRSYEVSPSIQGVHPQSAVESLVVKASRIEGFGSAGKVNLSEIEDSQLSTNKRESSHPQRQWGWPTAEELGGGRATKAGQSHSAAWRPSAEAGSQRWWTGEEAPLAQSQVNVKAEQRRQLYSGVGGGNSSRSKRTSLQQKILPLCVGKTPIGSLKRELEGRFRALDDEFSWKAP